VAGRNTKYSEEIVAEIVGIIGEGMSDKDACEMSGISYTTFYGWQREFPEFAQAITRARALNKAARIRRLNKAAQHDSRIDMWFLAHQYPDEYADQLVIKITSDQESLFKRFGLTPAQALEQFAKELLTAEQMAAGDDVLLLPTGDNEQASA
jgi:transposase